MRVSPYLLHLLLCLLGASSLVQSFLSTTRRKLPSPTERHETNEGDRWEKMGRISTISSPWLTLYCERLRDDKGKKIDYWRVKKDHSVIVLVIHQNRLIFPKKQYRPGVDRSTLDFAGGRRAYSSTNSLEKSVAGILKRELNVDMVTDLQRLEHLNKGSTGWFTDSSFSNQELFAFVAVLHDYVELDYSMLHDVTYAVGDMYAIDKLLADELLCLQCRSVLMEWLLRQRWSGRSS